MADEQTQVQEEAIGSHNKMLTIDGMDRFQKLEKAYIDEEFKVQNATIKTSFETQNSKLTAKIAEQDAKIQKHDADIKEYYSDIRRDRSKEGAYLFRQDKLQNFVDAAGSLVIGEINGLQSSESSDYKSYNSLVLGKNNDNTFKYSEQQFTPAVRNTIIGGQNNQIGVNSASESAIESSLIMGNSNEAGDSDNILVLGQNNKAYGLQNGLILGNHNEASDINNSLILGEYANLENISNNSLVIGGGSSSGKGNVLAIYQSKADNKTVTTINSNFGLVIYPEVTIYEKITAQSQLTVNGLITANKGLSVSNGLNVISGNTKVKTLSASGSIETSTDYIRGPEIVAETSMSTPQLICGSKGITSKGGITSEGQLVVSSSDYTEISNILKLVDNNAHQTGIVIGESVDALTGKWVKRGIYCEGDIVTAQNFKKTNPSAAGRRADSTDREKGDKSLVLSAKDLNAIYPGLYYISGHIHYANNTHGEFSICIYVAPGENSEVVGFHVYDTAEGKSESTTGRISINLNTKQITVIRDFQPYMFSAFLTVVPIFLA